MPRDIQECAALNYVYSCPGSPNIKELFLISRLYEKSYLMNFICLVFLEEAIINARVCSFESSI
jgi:hypothetical protein